MRLSKKFLVGAGMIGAIAIIILFRVWLKEEPTKHPFLVTVIALAMGLVAAVAHEVLINKTE